MPHFIKKQIHIQQRQKKNQINIPTVLKIIIRPRKHLPVQIQQQNTKKSVLNFVQSKQWTHQNEVKDIFWYLYC